MHFFVSFCWFTSAQPPPPKNKNRKFFWGTTMEINPHSFSVLSLPSHLVFIWIYFQFFYCRFIWKSYVKFSFIEFIFVMMKDTYLLIVEKTSFFLLSWKSDISLSLTRTSGIMGIFFVFKNLLIVDQYVFAAVSGLSRSSRPEVFCEQVIF